ncbi:MAG: hypothetical protein AB1295_05080 [Candidatus Micrarchaeota archaeon]
MGEHCKGKGESGECCGGCHHHEEVDVSSLGPEAMELAKKFEKVNDGLVSALQARQEILHMLHEKAAESPEMKEKMDKVIHSRHPVLLQFVFGSGPE